MPKLRCRCGNLINLSALPNPAGFSCFPEARLEDVVDGLASTLTGATTAPRESIESLLFEVSALAPWAFVAPAVALALAAALAAWVPAARAGRLPPAEVLRSE